MAMPTPIVHVPSTLSPLATTTSQGDLSPTDKAKLDKLTPTTALTVNTGTVTLVGNVANTSALTLGAGASSVSGANTGDETKATIATKTGITSAQMDLLALFADSTASTAYANEAPYYASGDTATTNTVGSLTSGSTVVNVADGSTFSDGQGIFIAGAGTTGADYIGTVVSRTSNAITITPATGTTVAAPPASTTVGSTAAGTSVVVASATGAQEGRGITIAGAGVGGTAYHGVIKLIAATTITLTTATTTVVAEGAAVTFDNVMHDDTAAIQAAATALTATGGTVFLGKNMYRVSSLITLPAGVNLLGQAVPLRIDGASFVYSPCAECGTVLISEKLTAFSFIKLGNGCAVRHVAFDSSVTSGYPSAGAVIDFSEARAVVLEDIYINRAYTGITCTNSAQVWQNFKIARVLVRNFRGNGIYLENAVIGSIDSVTFWNYGNSVNNSFVSNGMGLRLKNGTATIRVSKMLVQSTEYGIYAEGGAPGTWTNLTDDIHFTDYTCDSTSKACLYASNLTHSSFQGCYFHGAATTDAIRLLGYTTDLTIANSQFSASAYAGIHLESTNLLGIIISDNRFSQMCTYDVDGRNAIDVDANVGNFTISGNQFHLTDPYSASVSHMDYAVDVADGTSDHYVIVNNVGAGELGVVYDGGTGLNKTVTGNVA